MTEADRGPEPPRSKPLAARLYRKTADTVEPLLPAGLRTPAHYMSRRLTRRMEAEYDTLMSFAAPGTIAVDIGANIGIYTYGLLARGADVHAFEPQQSCADQIIAFYALGFPRVKPPARRGRLFVHVEALSSERGEAVLYVPLKRGKVDSESASLNAGTGNTLRQEVAVRRLDDYELDEVKVIKIDVEGREIGAIAGAAATIARSRPVLLVEIEQRHHREAIDAVFDQILSTLGPQYEVRFLSPQDGSHTLVRFDTHRDSPPAGSDPQSQEYVRNFFFLPV